MQNERSDKAILTFAINKHIKGPLVVGSEGGDSCSEQHTMEDATAHALARDAAYGVPAESALRSGQHRYRKELD